METRSFRELRRSRSNRVLAGVCGGLGVYLGVDPVIVRIAFVALALAGGGGLLLYVIAWIAIPEDTDGADVAGPYEEQRAAAARQRADGTRLIVGGLLIAIGTVLLVDKLFPTFDRVVWPVVLIVVGIGVLLQGTRR